MKSPSLIIILNVMTHVFFFFWLVKDNALKQLNNYIKNRTHLVEQHTITVILKSITNVHRWTTKGNKIYILDSTHLSQQICTSIGLAVAMVKANSMKARCQAPTIIRQRRNDIVNTSNILKNLYHSLSIQFNNKRVNV